MTPHLLELENLAVGYRAPLASGIDLRIRAGEFVTVMGENGIGKTTLLETILGSLKPLAGKVRLFGETVTLAPRPHELQSRIAWVFAHRERYPLGLTVGSLLDATSLLYPRWDDRLCEELLHRFQLDRRKSLSVLSLGEHSKMKLTRALAASPDLLILDELTANLSPESRRVVLETLLGRFTERPLAVLYISHFEKKRCGFQIAAIE